MAEGLLYRLFMHDRVEVICSTIVASTDRSTHTIHKWCDKLIVQGNFELTSKPDAFPNSSIAVTAITPSPHQSFLFPAPSRSYLSWVTVSQRHEREV